jgi:hypothetical protein
MRGDLNGPAGGLLVEERGEAVDETDRVFDRSAVSGGDLRVPGARDAGYQRQYPGPNAARGSIRANSAPPCRVSASSSSNQ